MTPVDGTPASAGRPRSEEAHQAILDATLELLAEVGFSALTVEGVASRAGVGKATIYRRWASKLPLVIEAFGGLPGARGRRHRLGRDRSQDDAAQLPRALPQDAARGGAAEPRGRARPQRRALAALRAGDEGPAPAARALLQRGVARGELRQDLDLELAADLVVGPIAVRLFFTGRPLQPDLVDPMVELALGGLKRR